MDKLPEGCTLSAEQIERIRNEKLWPRGTVAADDTEHAVYDQALRALAPPASEMTHDDFTTVEGPYHYSEVGELLHPLGVIDEACLLCELSKPVAAQPCEHEFHRHISAQLRSPVRCATCGDVVSAKVVAAQPAEGTPIMDEIYFNRDELNAANMSAMYHAGQKLERENQALVRQVAELQESHALQMAGISMAAGGNIREVWETHQLTNSSPYYSRAYEEVHAAVGREIAERERADAAQSQIAKIREACDFGIEQPPRDDYERGFVAAQRAIHSKIEG